MAITFKPELFVDSGSTGAMFTLRRTYLHTHYLRGEGPMGGAVVNGVYQGQVCQEVRTTHVQNLGQDPHEAYARAVRVSTKLALPLTTRLEALLTDTLRAIHRRTDEEIRRENADRNLRLAQRADERMMSSLTRRPLDRCDHPKHRGKSFEQIAEFDRPYLEWLAGRAPHRVPEWELRRLFLETWLEKHPAPLVRNEHLGLEGERIEIRGRVTFTKQLDSAPDEWPRRRGKVLVKVRTDSGHLVVTFYGGYRWNPAQGDTCHLAGTVKSHNRFRGQAETMLCRIAVRDEPAPAVK